MGYSTMMIYKAKPVLGAIAISLLLGSVTGCTSSESFGLEKEPPDEFAVVTRAPLSMPPDYGLRPPEPGAPRPQETPVQVEARQTLLRSGGSAPTSASGGDTLSKGESALLGRAGAATADGSIRQTVARENAVLAENQEGFVDRLIFWQKPEPTGTIIDPEAESRRIRENAALGEPVTKGPTPVIERKKKGLFEGIIN